MHSTPRRQLARLGSKVVACTIGCEAASSVAEGTPPRCMYLEQDSAGTNGVVIVGLNPGRASDEEKRYYAVNGAEYRHTVAYLKTEMNRIKYYKYTRSFVLGLGFSGPIHWTELAKCELRRGIRSVPAEMISTCTRTFLHQELALLAGWPVVAIGRVAFNAISLMCPDRSVIGIPHTTGSWGAKFSSLCSPGTHTPRPEVLNRVAGAIRRCGVVWLD